MVRTSRLAPALGIVVCAFGATWGLSACVQASQTYLLEPRTSRIPAVSGSVQVERIEGGQRLLAVSVRDLPVPEALGLREFAVWVRDAEGRTVKLGTLRYDRPQGSGSLLGLVEATRAFRFTVQVTGERDENASAPSELLLAERTVINH